MKLHPTQNNLLANQSLALKILLWVVIVLTLMGFYLQTINFIEEKQINISGYRDKKKLKLRKPDILLFIGIYSWISFIDRRISIRKTWMPPCKQNNDTVCFFMMDAFDFKGNRISKEKLFKYQKENETNHDIMIQNSFEGINYAYRYFTTVIWAYERYNFEFLLRTDDDSYLCFDHLMYELPYRRKEKNLMWGYEKCKHEQTQIDEGWMIISKDLAMEFINRFNTTLICHKYTSVAISLFIIAMKNEFNVTWFGDTRVFFAYDIAGRIHYNNLCNHYIGLHLVYSKEIMKLHDHHLKTTNVKYEIPPIKDLCPNSHRIIDVHKWSGRYFAEPVLCKSKPIWSKVKMYSGGEGRTE